MLNTLLSPWLNFSWEEVDAVSIVFLSKRVNYWTGQECQAFEQDFAEWTGIAYDIALANSTVSLDLALHGLGIGGKNGGTVCYWHLMVHYPQASGRMYYGPDTTWERPHDRGSPSSDTT